MKNPFLKYSLKYAQNIVDTVREPLLILGSDLRVISANRSFYKIFKVIPEETVGQFIYDLGNQQWDIPKFRELLEEILPKSVTFNDYEVEHEFPVIGRKIMLLNARKLFRETNQTEMILLAIEDITERKRLEKCCRKEKIISNT
ncbi:PAS domain-containing protein [Candidatus Auribacterota bacterium]